MKALNKDSTTRKSASNWLTTPITANIPNEQKRQERLKTTSWEKVGHKSTHFISCDHVEHEENDENIETEILFFYF